MSSVPVDKFVLAEMKTADDRGRISLGKKFADKRVFVIVDDRNDVIDLDDDE